MPTYQDIYGSGTGHNHGVGVVRPQQTATEAPKPATPKRGRPRKDAKPSQGSMTQRHLERLYHRVEHMLDEDHKLYLSGVITGKINIDAVFESELLLRYLSILVTESIGWSLESRSVSQDIAKIIGEYRMGIKDLEEMRRKREEQRVKLGKDESVVDPTSDVARRRFEDLVGQYTTD